LTWDEVALGDHVDLLSGFPFKSAKFTTAEDSVRLLKGSVVSQADLDWSGSVGWPSDDADDYRKFELKIGDVVLAMDRPWVEAGLKYAWITADDIPCLLVQRVARLRGRNGLETAFLRYIVGGPDFTNYVAPIVIGVNVPHISPRQICSFRFRLPPTSVQLQIAGILSAYDDLIENNNRRVKILEEMVQRIYHEWLVDFRYPGHEHVPLIASELGPIPQGWVVRKLGDVVSQGRLTLDPRQFPGEVFQHYSIPSFDGGRLPRLELGSTIRSNKFLVEHPAVLYSKLNPRIPRVWMVTPRSDARSISSTELLVLTARSHWNRPFIYSLLRSESFADRMIGMAGGTSTSHQRVRPNEILAVPVADPGKNLCDRFERMTGDALALAGQLRNSSSLLRTTRDLLVPRLISGEMDVTDLKIAMPAVAA
jgi:type I restriction enzyme S subunit